MHEPSPDPPGESSPVVIVGGGPVGLSLALGLARQGVRSILFEKEAGTSERSKASGIHVRTREVLRQWDIEERFLDAGVLVPRLTIHDARAGRAPRLTIDSKELEPEVDRPGIMVLEQGRTERFLLDVVLESGHCDVRFGAEVIGLTPGERGAEVTVREADRTYAVEGRFVVGCDGASSFVRDALGLPFEGITYSIRPMLADVRISDERDALPWPRLRNARSGLTFTVRLSPGLWRIVHLQRRDPEGDDEAVAEGELAGLVERVLGPGRFDRVWASRFRIHRRACPRFRVGPILLAGDAAHVHSPAGGLGMNSGIQDAHNLAWKLAAALGGGDVDRLLNSYDEERREVVVGRVTRYADLITRSVLQMPPVLREVAFLWWRLALRLPPVRRRVLRRATMIDLDYAASPILDPEVRSAGMRLPNPLLRAEDGAAVRLYELIHYRAALLVLGSQAVPAEGTIRDVIRIGPGGYTDAAGVLVGLLGREEGWILVRPDAHVGATGTEPAEVGRRVKTSLAGHL